MKATAHNILKLASKIANPGRVRFRAQRAGMAGGFTATSRFVGPLVRFAALGAAMAHVASGNFIASGVAAGSMLGRRAELAERVTSGDVRGIVGTVAETLRTSIWQIDNAAFADGFATPLLLAAAIAAATALLTRLLVRRYDVRERPLDSKAVKWG
jgi:hypothetical protein